MGDVDRAVGGDTICCRGKSGLSEALNCLRSRSNTEWANLIWDTSVDTLSCSFRVVWSEMRLDADELLRLSIMESDPAFEDEDSGEDEGPSDCICDERDSSELRQFESESD